MSKKKIKVDWKEKPNKKGYWYAKQGTDIHLVTVFFGAKPNRLDAKGKRHPREISTLEIVEEGLGVGDHLHRRKLEEWDVRTKWAFACPFGYDINCR